MTLRPGWEGEARDRVPLGGELDLKLRRRTGRTRGGSEEKGGGGLGSMIEDEDEQEEVMSERAAEGGRLSAVYAARERRSRAVEGRWQGWREGRACSLAEWSAPRGDDWQVVQPKRRAEANTRRHMRKGAMIELMRGGVWTRGEVRMVGVRDGRFVHVVWMVGAAAAEEVNLQMEEWRVVGGGGGGCEGMARGRAWEGGVTRQGGGSRTGVPPARLSDVWMLRRKEMQRDRK